MHGRLGRPVFRCTIARTVVSDLEAMGIAAETVQMDGAETAANWLSSLSPDIADGNAERCLIPEITFCADCCSTMD